MYMYVCIYIYIYIYIYIEATCRGVQGVCRGAARGTGYCRSVQWHALSLSQSLSTTSCVFMCMRYDISHTQHAHTF